MTSPPYPPDPVVVPEPAARSLPDRVRLVVLFGGRSAEHDISCISAANVVRAVDPDRYLIELVGIDRDGGWHRADGAAAALAAGASPSALDVAGPTTDHTSAFLPTEPDDTPTVVLPILHGPNGEDGTVQGLLEVLDLPYVGSGVLGSALCMDKAAAKTVLRAHDLPQAEWLQLDRSVLGDAGHRAQVLSRLGATVFVKPANMGSSIGISRATGDDELLAALREAFRHDAVVVVEEALDVRELETAVLGPANGLRVSLVGEIVPAAEFYDFDDKYRDGAARTVVPADLPHDLAEQARSLAIRAAWALRVEGMARVDLFLAEGRGLLVNEVNTIPGFTPISMYPVLWEASGVGYSALLDELVALALARHAARSARG